MNFKKRGYRCEGGLLGLAGKAQATMAPAKPTTTKAVSVKPKKHDKSEGFSLKIWSEMAWEKRKRTRWVR
ncbi:hypothetical protein [Acanthopleuribacter pedis]|uniref:Uncharacterized protein n=1 Tax=Acanthopleuribacter pedis TaxID=442870 RepID=A0A8J7Q4I1_9BACT|nr:hypothetical protein [Acanthopleuribacter pedis]MBO1317922.1 hypothetical protein [Acanthopleuribacter pedis]